MNIKFLSKIGLLALIMISWTSAVQGQEGRIKVILAGGTDITDIGPGCKVSVDLMKDAYDYIADVTGMEVDYSFCTGDNFNKEYILHVVDNVESGMYDAIVFFNSSHGFNYQNTVSQHTFFVAHPTESGSMSQEEFVTYGISLEKEIFNTLQTKGSPRVLVFSESCNQAINMEVPNMYKTMNLNIAKRLKELFLGPPVEMISSSSEYGQYSYTDNDMGGIYVNSLLHAMNDVTTKCDKASWDLVMSKTQNYVRQYADNLDGGQTAIYDINDATPIKLEESTSPKKSGNGGYVPSRIRIKN